MPPGHDAGDACRNTDFARVLQSFLVGKERPKVLIRIRAESANVERGGAENDSNWCLFGQFQIDGSQLLRKSLVDWGICHIPSPHCFLPGCPAHASRDVL